MAGAWWLLKNGDRSFRAGDLLNSTDMLICITDPETDEVVFISECMCALLGIDLSEPPERRRAIARQDDILRADEDAKRRLADDPSAVVTLDEYSPSSGRFFKRRDSTIKDSQGRALHMHIFREVAASGAALDSRSALRRERELRKELLLDLSHDLRTHLHVILSMANVAREKRSLDVLRSSVDKISRASANMLIMLDEMLEMAGMESLDSVKWSKTSTELALYETEDRSIREARERSIEIIRSIAGCRVLLAEDDEIHREIMSMLLEGTDVELEIAVNGREAVDVYAADPGRFDLILMDVHMPVMGGLEAARSIRALNDERAASVPMIAMTANALIEDEELSFAAGMNGHITKPVDWTDLLSLLAYHLQRDPARRS